jgi:hypothetical protein
VGAGARDRKREPQHPLPLPPLPRAPPHRRRPGVFVRRFPRRLPRAAPRAALTPLAGRARQYSPSKEFVGGTADWGPARAARARAAAPLGAGGGSADAAPGSAGPRRGGGGGAGAAAGAEKSNMWKELLPRRQFRGVCWVTLHEAQGLVNKIIGSPAGPPARAPPWVGCGACVRRVAGAGTRDPYVRLRMAGQTEKSTAKARARSPVGAIHMRSTLAEHRR